MLSRWLITVDINCDRLAEECYPGFSTVKSLLPSLSVLFSLEGYHYMNSIPTTWGLGLPLLEEGMSTQNIWNSA